MRVPERSLHIFSCCDCEPASNFPQANSPVQLVFPGKASCRTSPRRRMRPHSIGPKKVFQAEMIQPGLCLFASVATRRSQAFINRSRGFPFRLFLQESGGIKSGLVIPEKFTLPVFARFFVQNFIKRLERASAVFFLFQTECLFE